MDALITGTGESPYTRHPPAGTDTLGVLADAARRALTDAGVEPRDVDGLGVASFSLPPDRAIDVAWRLGLRPRWLMDSWLGGAAGVDLLQHARRAVESGDARAVLLVAGDHMDGAAFARLVDDFNSATRDHLAAIPVGGPNALFALLTRRHMARHALDRAAYGQVAITQRAWAAGNPDAVYREPLTLEAYLAAPVVVDPLVRYDCVPVVTGANAIVVTSVQPRRGRAVRVRAVAARHNADQQEGDGLTTGLAEVAPALWAAAGLGPADVDVVSVYDDYTTMVLVQLADLGFAPDGDVAALVNERIATRRLPVNTSGGQLSAGQAGAAGGMHGLVEVVRQLRGQAAGRQVARARVGLVSGYGMVAYAHCAGSNAVVLEAA